MGVGGRLREAGGDRQPAERGAGPSAGARGTPVESKGDAMDTETVTVLLVLSGEERAALDRLQSRPEEVGATEGPLRIEEIRDLHTSDRGTVVQVEVANPGGAGETADILEDRLRRRMAEIDSTGAIRD